MTAYEKVTVPAGNFDTYRIDSTLRTENGAAGKVTYWVDAQGTVVRMVRSVKISFHTGQTRDDSWTREATRIHRPR